MEIHQCFKIPNGSLPPSMAEIHITPRMMTHHHQRRWSGTIPQSFPMDHTINISHIAGTSVNFMVVTAGSTTPLLTQTLIVDDDDSDIVYSGSWMQNGSRYTESGSPHADLSYHNLTHQATSAGPSATFRFRGEHLSSLDLFCFP